VTRLIAVTITVLINVAITDVLTIIRIVLLTAPTTIVTVVPIIIVTTILRIVRPHPMIMTAVAAVPRATTSTHALVVTHTAVIGPRVPLPYTNVRNLLREFLTDFARPEAVILAPNIMIHLLNVGESCLGGDIFAQER